MPKISLKFEARLLPVLVAGLLLIDLLGGYLGLRIIFVGLAGAWLIAYFWSKALAKGLSLKREVRFGWLQVGDRVVERLSITNHSRFPALWVEVEDHSTLPGAQVNRSLTLGGRDTIRWFKEALCTRRGIFTLGPMILRAGDPFGFYSIALEYPSAVPILVLPQVVQTPIVKLATGGRAGAGLKANRTLERTVSVSSLREYMPGDHSRWIHWPTTLRRDGLFVRIFDAAPSGDLWIVMDMNGDAHYGEGQDSSEEHAVILAASLADLALRSGRAVGLVAADRDLTWLAPRGGEGQRWQVLHSLALVSRGSYKLGSLLSRLAYQLGRESSLVLITSDASPDWLEPLAMLREMGSTPTVLLLDPATFGGPEHPVQI